MTSNTGSKPIAELPRSQATGNSVTITVSASGNTTLSQVSGLPTVMTVNSNFFSSSSNSNSISSGTIITDGSFLYMITSDNQVKRVALSTF